MVNQTVQKKLSGWMKMNNSIHWAIGCKICQWRINTQVHQTLKDTPYHLTYGTHPRVGISNQPVSEDILAKLVTEGELQDVYQQLGSSIVDKDANNLFNSLNVSNEWNIPQKHRVDACFNCGDPDHGVPKSPKPIDQHRIDKAKAEFSKTGGGRGGRGGRGGGGRFACRGRGNGGNQTNTRGKWKGNDAKVSAALTTNGGIGKHNRKWSKGRNFFLTIKI